METDITDLDSTNSSSCASAVMLGRRASEASCRAQDVIEEEEAELDGLSEAERGRSKSSASAGTDDHDADNTINDALAASTTSGGDTDDTTKIEDINPLLPEASLDWQTETCAICLEPYKENDEVSYSKHQNCSHAFHTCCIVAWGKDRNDCPCCRGPYLHLCVLEDESDYCLGVSSSSSNDGASIAVEGDASANAMVIMGSSVTDTADVIDATNSNEVPGSDGPATTVVGVEDLNV